MERNRQDRGGGPRGDRGPRRRDEDDGGNEFEERVVQINRVSKVHKGGRSFAFSAMVVVGDGKGRVGVGLGKAGEVPDSIRKAVEAAKKNLITIPLDGTTLPHEVEEDYAASRVMLKPAAPGTGVIAGGSVRAVLEVAGVRDVLSKSLGSDNPINVVRATLQALQALESEEAVMARRGLKRRLRRPRQAPSAEVLAAANRAAQRAAGQQRGGAQASAQGRGVAGGDDRRGGGGAGGRGGGPGGRGGGPGGRGPGGRGPGGRGPGGRGPGGPGGRGPGGPGGPGGGRRPQAPTGE